jgi:hypothetical protein
MPKPKLPPDVFVSYVPPEPPRAIIVSKSTMAFATAVYQLGIEPDSAWRAVSIEQAHELQAEWLGQGIRVYLVPLPDDLQTLEADEPTPISRGRSRQNYQSFERERGDETADEGTEAA